MANRKQERARDILFTLAIALGVGCIGYALFFDALLVNKWIALFLAGFLAFAAHRSLAGWKDTLDMWKKTLDAHGKSIKRIAVMDEQMTALAAAYCKAVARRKEKTTIVKNGDKAHVDIRKGEDNTVHITAK